MFIFPTGLFLKKGFRLFRLDSKQKKEATKLSMTLEILVFHSSLCDFSASAKIVQNP